MDYRLEEAIYNISDYDDMCFSFDMGIGYDDSMPLAIAEKCVYQVFDFQEIDEYISNVDGEIDAIFFIVDYQVEDETGNQNEMKKVLLGTKEHIYENERYCSLKLE